MSEFQEEAKANENATPPAEEVGTVGNNPDTTTGFPNIPEGEEAPAAPAEDSAGDGDAEAPDEGGDEAAPEGEGEPTA